MDQINPAYQYLGVEVFPFMKQEYAGPNVTKLVLDVGLAGSETGSHLWKPLW